MWTAGLAILRSSRRLAPDLLGGAFFWMWCELPDPVALWQVECEGRVLAPTKVPAQPTAAQFGATLASNDQARASPPAERPP
jgi:hypothetical protein